MASSASSRAWPTVVVYLAIVFALTKLAATLVLIRDGGTLAPLVAWLPGLWLDVLLWTAAWWLTRPLARHPAAWGLVLPAVGLALYQAGSWTSFLVTQTWLTWQRLRGDEEVKIGDLGELGASYGVPMIVLMVLMLVAVGVAWRLTCRERLVDGLRSFRVGLIAPVVALVLFVVDLGTASYGLYGLSEQPLVELFTSATTPPEPTKAPLKRKDWLRLHRPTAIVDEGLSPPSPRETPKNLVLYLAEGIPTEHTSFGDKVDTTPHVKRRWEDHGLLFDNFYTHTHRSIHAIFSVVCSEYPPPTLDAMTALHPRIDCGSLMETLKTVPGLHQGLFHGGRFSFANKLALLSGRGFEVTRDAEDLSMPDKWREDWWGIDDRAVADAALSWVDTVPDDEGFFLLIIPIAPHEPYDIPDVKEVPARIAGGTSEANKYLRAVTFADIAFERLMKGLEERGRYEDTMTVWVPDHGNHIDEPSRPSRGKRMLYEQNVQVPLVFLQPGAFGGGGLRTHRLAAQIDLSPTLTAMMGADEDPRDKGQDLFSSSYEQRRVYLLKTRGNSPFIGLVDGKYKFIFDIRPKRLELYDLETDPEELENIAEDHLPRVSGYARDGVRFRESQRQTLLNVPALDEETGDLEALFEKATISCAGAPCPKEVSMRVVECKGNWAKAPCLSFSVPANLTIDVALPGSIVGRFDSVRVRWWNRERRKAKTAELSMQYGDKVIPPRPTWHDHDTYRVLSVPHDVLEGQPPIVVSITSPVAHKPMIEFTEH